MIRLVAAVLCLGMVAGCATTAQKGRKGDEKKPFVKREMQGVWKPEAFGTVLRGEVSLNRNYFKAAPQLKSYREVLRLSEAINDEFSFKVVDDLETAPAPMGSEAILFQTFGNPKLAQKGETRFELERGEETQVFDIAVRVLPPIAYRIGAQHGPVKKKPVLKTIKIQYRLVCSPGEAGERVLCFHRELRLDPVANMEEEE